MIKSVSDLLRSPTRLLHDTYYQATNSYGIRITKFTVETIDYEGQLSLE